MMNMKTGEFVKFVVKVSLETIFVMMVFPVVMYKVWLWLIVNL